MRPQLVMTPDAATPAPLPPPVRKLGDQLFDYLIWGGLAVMLALAFGPAEISKAPLLVTHSEQYAGVHERLPAAGLRPVRRPMSP